VNRHHEGAGVLVAARRHEQRRCVHNLGVARNRSESVLPSLADRTSREGEPTRLTDAFDLGRGQVAMPSRPGGHLVAGPSRSYQGGSQLGGISAGTARHWTEQLLDANRYSHQLLVHVGIG
jgi:hypothetical protein